jgi:hypothetical protein
MAGIPSELTCIPGDVAEALGSSDANSRTDVENHSYSKDTVSSRRQVCTQLCMVHMHYRRDDEPF